MQRCIIFGVIFAIIVAVLWFFLLAAMGNLTCMKILAKNGLAVFCGDSKKDYKLLKFVNSEGVAWLSVPHVCYAPVMLNKNGFYRNHNFLKKENSHGELYLSKSNTAKAMKQFSRKTNKEGLRDLTVITGSPYSAGNSLRHSNFSNLERYAQEAIGGKAEDIEIYDSSGRRRFKIAMVVDITKGARQTAFKMNSRETILEGLKDTSIWNNGADLSDKEVILLRYYTNITNMTLIFYEVK